MHVDRKMQDLILIHWPAAAKLPLRSPLHAQLRLQTWRVLEDFYSAGRSGPIEFEGHDAGWTGLLTCVTSRLSHHIRRAGWWLCRCRAIGVSNYTQYHLEELLLVARIKPMVNQAGAL